MGIRSVGRAARAVGIGIGVAGAVALSGCGSDDADETVAAVSGQEAAALLASCGEGTKAATGKPITVGAIVTKLPGVDLTPVSNSTKAYFDCVNAHGGVGGRPIEFKVEHDQLNPQATSALASKLLDQDRVVAMIGNTSLIDCSVNGKAYEQADLSIIGAAVDTACFNLTNFASAALGPMLSAQLVAQYQVAEQGADALHAMTTQAPGSEALNAGIVGVGKDRGVQVIETMVKVPITDPNGIALSGANKAGSNGGVVLDLAPPELVKLLGAAGKQGLADRAHWGCVNACANPTLLKTLDSSWNDKLVVPNEFPVVDADSPDMNLYRAVNEKYNGGTELTTFNQLGFLMGKLFADTVQQLPADELDREGINRAVGAISNYETDMLCEPFSFDKGKPHVSVSAARLFVPKDGKLEQIQDCTPVDAVTPIVRAARGAS